jgi:8-oxo-dGTP pyrophosphatase MutT (NUDIX family)
LSDEAVQEGVVAVVMRDDRFLMIQRAAGILAGGAWCFVGGGIEPGESQDHAVQREFFEEMGGRISALHKLWEWVRADGRLRLHWWLCDLEPGALQANLAEVQDYGWYKQDELLGLPGLLESNREFVACIGIALVDGDGAN